ncbi:hypothetical protein C981_01640 [Brucella abortus 78/32]|nr:hypothetical protein BCA52141_I2344 [Brucella canis HSK A52141]EFG38665.1 conserved hypothetical protein [Brucella sp. NVSL 07-0026]ENR07535.1 hypothetical protein C961_01703 [Brucella ovis F8/05B]ENR89233.1 hypothetical protein C981_01640 [Brucella abortus 78/32]ENR91610.1 hypothetical protein C043_01632 [Brucella abortus 80/101]
MQGILYEEPSFWLFFLITCLLGGWAAGRHGWQAAPAHPHGGPMCSS